MNRRQPLRNADARGARVHVVGAFGRRGFDFIGGVRIRGLELGAMHFALPLQIGILVHFTGPHRGIELEAAGDGDHFLSVGNAADSGDARNLHALGAAEVAFVHFRAAAGTHDCAVILRGRRPRRIHGAIAALRGAIGGSRADWLVLGSVGTAALILRFAQDDTVFTSRFVIV